MPKFKSPKRKKGLAIRLTLHENLLATTQNLLVPVRIKENQDRLKGLEDRQHFRRWDFCQGVMKQNTEALRLSRAKLKGKLWGFKRMCRGLSRAERARKLRLGFLATFGPRRKP